MSDRDSELFCPSLQKEWFIQEASYTEGSVKLLLEHTEAERFPDPLGRPGHLVTAEPRVFQVRESAEVTFKRVLWFEVVDEFSFSTSDRAEGKDEAYSGDRFRCFKKSLLLADQRKSRTETEAANLKHYQLVTQNQIVNVVCADAPQISLCGNS